MIATITTVHTSGINWESLGVILGALAAVVALLVGLQERRNKTITDQITTSVDHLSDVLQAKLETKETVASLSVRVARMEGMMVGSGHSPEPPGGPHGG